MGHGRETAPGQFRGDGEGVLLPCAARAVGYRNKQRGQAAQTLHRGVKFRQLGRIRGRKKFQGTKRRAGGADFSANVHTAVLLKDTIHQDGVSGILNNCIKIS